MTRLSVIIVTYDGLPFLHRCLDSVVREVDAHSEVIVIDNASTDGSAEFLQNQYPQISLIRNETNLGFARACNQGAQVASGRHLVFLNQDTAVLPGWLSELEKVLDKDPSAGLVTSKALLMSDPTRINACGLDIHYSGLSAARGFMCDSAKFLRPVLVSAVCGASFAVRAELWRQLEGFDEGFFMYYEETDLSWRAQLMGYECVCVPGSIIRHAHSLSPSELQLYYSERNRWIVLLKNWRWGTLVLLLPALVLAELVEWGYLVSMGKHAVRAKMRAAAWVLTHLPQVLHARKRVQATRVVADHHILRNRVWQLSPKQVTVGPIGKLALRICNVFFRGVYLGCLFMLRTLRL